MAKFINFSYSLYIFWRFNNRFDLIDFLNFNKKLQKILNIKKMPSNIMRNNPGETN